MSRSKIVKISQLRIGQRFSFIPSDWFGPARLTEKSRDDDTEVFLNPLRFVRHIQYDIKFDANVVNPPGVIYGISGDAKVRLLSKKPQVSRKGHRAGYVV